MCVHLSIEERHALHELVDCRTDERSVEAFINHRLYSELSRSDGRNEFGESLRTRLPGYHEQMQVYVSLSEKGLLSANRPAPNVYWFGDLTPEGRCYFIDEAARKAEEASRIRSNRAHDWRIALFGIIGGLFSGAFGSWILDALITALSSTQ